MQEILTNEKAQEIIDYVSQIYGESYVGLWLFQTIGSVIGPIYDTASQLRYETSPATTTLLLPYYEAEYGIQPDPTMTIEQRRNLVVSTRRSKQACTPARLADAVSAALGGVPVEIIEYDGQSISQNEIDNIVIYGANSGKIPDGITTVSTSEINDIVINGINSGQTPNEETSVTTSEIDDIVTYGIETSQDAILTQYDFIVNIRATVRSLAPAIAVIERMKPAHLSYKMQGVVQENVTAEITIGTALTTAELFKVEVQS